MLKHKSIFVGAWALTFVVSVVALVRSSEIRLAAKGVPAVARLGKTNGKVQARGEDALGWASVEAGDELHDGDSVATGDASTARLEFPDGRVLDVGAGTLMEIRAQGSGANAEYLVSLLKGLVVADAQAQKAPSARHLKIVAGTKEFALDDAPTDLAIAAKSRTREAEVLFASKEVAVRDVRSDAAPTMLAPVAKVASIAAVTAAPVAPVAAPLPELTEDATVQVVDSAPAPADTPKSAAALTDVPKPAPVAVAKPARVVYPASGTTFWVLDPSAKIPVRVEAHQASAVVELQRTSGARGKKRLTFAGTRTDAAFTAADLLGSLRAGDTSFNVKSFQDLAGAVTVEADDLAEAAPGPYLVEKRLKTATGGQQIRLAASQDLPKLAPLLAGAAAFRIVKSTGLAEEGTFLVRKGQVVAEVLNGDAALFCKRLGCDLMFKGRRDAVATTAQIEAAMKGKKKTYMVMNDTLVPLNWGFFQQFSEVRDYVGKKSPVVFTEPVELVTATGH
jgi:hypothetical protein